MHGCIKSAAPVLTIIALIYVLIRDWKLSHLKKKVCNLEKKNIRSQGKIKKQISALLQQHSQYRIDITDNPILTTQTAPETGDYSGALALALQEKVSSLLLLSQQEERHLLERNVNAALQKKIEELQRNLLQVGGEKETIQSLFEIDNGL
ncbi:hypothetical protein ACS0TY_000803 [Phlomoides rotata]